MNYKDIAMEAVLRGVCLVEGISGTIRWYANIERQKLNQASAWMSRMSLELNRAWCGYDKYGVRRCSGTKALVAQWCMEEAIKDKS